MSDTEGDNRMPINTGEPMATQSRHALMIAHDQGWLTYLYPADTRRPEHMERLRAELGETADLPTDGGVYYLIHLRTSTNETVRVLVPEGEARGFVFGVAATMGRAAAALVQYRPGTLPTA